MELPFHPCSLASGTSAFLVWSRKLQRTAPVELVTAARQGHHRRVAPWQPEMRGSAWQDLAQTILRLTNEDLHLSSPILSKLKPLVQ